MHRPDTSLLALAALSSLALLGCADTPPTPTEVRSRISSDLGNVLRETNAAVTGSKDSVPAASALAMLDRTLGNSSFTASAFTTAARFAPGSHADPTTGDTVDVDASISYLDDQLFTDANHVGDGVYQVPASLVCSKTTIDSTGHEVVTIDAKCADALAKADLRIRVAHDGDALVFAIQLDANHDEPLRFTLTHTSLAITVDLDGMQRAIVALAGLLGEDVPNVALAGEATAKLEVLGTAKLRASLAIDRALSIKLAKAGADLNGPDAIAFASAKADVASLTLDGAAKSGSLSIGLGETALAIPAIFNASKRIELDLPGATANAAFAAGQPLKLTHLGLGSRTTTLSVNGARAVAIDVNPQDGRAFDATISRDAATGKTTVAVAPRVDLQLAVDHAVLGDTAPVYDVTRVQLDGSLRGSDSSKQVEVLTGSYTVTTAPAGHGFSASAGQCVTSSTATDPATGRSYTQFSVGVCQ
jgi:hypothetical protein